MKIKLESSYELFRDCKGHGTAFGCQWWVVTRVCRITTVVMIVVLPDEKAAKGLDEYGSFKFEYLYKDNKLTAKPIQQLWEWYSDDIRAYPDSMAGAVYMEMAIVPEAAIGPREDNRDYVVEKVWLKHKNVGKYDYWFNRQRLTEDELLSSCEAIVKFVCEKMVLRGLI